MPKTYRHAAHVFPKRAGIMFILAFAQPPSWEILHGADIAQETLDAALEPLLLQQKFKQGGTEMIKASPEHAPYRNGFIVFLAIQYVVVFRR